MDKQRASTVDAECRCSELDQGGQRSMPIVYIGKWWANDKAVCPPYTSWSKTAEAVLLQAHRILVYNDERRAWERYNGKLVVATIKFIAE